MGAHGLEGKMQTLKVEGVIDKGMFACLTNSVKSIPDLQVGTKITSMTISMV